MSIGNKTIIKQLMAISIQNNAQGDFHHSNHSHKKYVTCSGYLHYGIKLWNAFKALTVRQVVVQRMLRFLLPVIS